MLADIENSQAQAEKLLRVVTLCYQYAYLIGRLQVGLHLNLAEAARLASLRKLLESPGERRSHRRMPVALPVVVKTAGSLRRAMLLNVSGRGMLVATDEPIALGQQVLVKIGGQVEYSFPCVVRRLAESGGLRTLGLQMCGIPVEVRRGGSRPS
jgi:hypothetical protein